MSGAADPVAALFLGPIKRQVRLLDQIFFDLRIRWKRGDSDGNRDLGFLPAQDDALLFNLFTKFFGEFNGFFFGAIRQEHRELFTAVPADNISRHTEHFREDHRHRA